MRRSYCPPNCLSFRPTDRPPTSPGREPIPHLGSILSVNVGMPRKVSTANDSTVLTSIFKSPVEGRVAVRRHNIDGDRQSDLTVHGGPGKAVYCYPAEHYDYWKEKLADRDLSVYGAFGENLTTAGILEDEVWIGDSFRAGSAILQVTQPRMPCFKLGIRFNLSTMVKLFWQSGRSGIYFSIVKEGVLAAGDSVERIARGPEEITVADVVRLCRGDEKSSALRDRALRSPLSGSWKQDIRERSRQLAPL
jgi:MOSC domain-containing protein YiiM